MKGSPYLCLQFYIQLTPRCFSCFRHWAIRMHGLVSANKVGLFRRFVRRFSEGYHVCCKVAGVSIFGVWCVLTPNDLAVWMLLPPIQWQVFFRFLFYVSRMLRRWKTRERIAWTSRVSAEYLFIVQGPYFVLWLHFVISHLFSLSHVGSGLSGRK
jgi:hypothetical protein